MRDIKFIYKMDISHRADENGECWPAVKRIASDTKMSEATVRRAVRELRKEKLIKTEQRYRYYGEKSTLLFFLPHAKRKEKEKTA